MASDAFTAFPAHLPGHAFYTSKEIQQTIATLASESGAIQFSSLFLEQEYSRYGMITHTQGVGSQPACPC